MTEGAERADSDDTIRPFHVDVPGPAQLVEQGYPTLTYFHEAAKGGHFAAWEESELFATEIRAASKSLR